MGCCFIFVLQIGSIILIAQSIASLVFIGTEEHETTDKNQLQMLSSKAIDYLFQKGSYFFLMLISIFFFLIL